jgi:hypothetical protein
VPEPSATFVPLAFVLAALMKLAGMSATSALLAVVRICADDSDAYFHDGDEDPHPDFWRFLEEIKADGSDLIPTWDISLPPLRNVMICWEDVAEEYPQIGDPPPQSRKPPSEPAEKAPPPAAASAIAASAWAMPYAMTPRWGVLSEPIEKAPPPARNKGGRQDYDWPELDGRWENAKREFANEQALREAARSEVLRKDRRPTDGGPKKIDTVKAAIKKYRLDRFIK